MFRQLYFLEGRLVAESPRGLVPCHEVLAEPTSDLYFCHICGDVFARFPILRADGSSTTWQSYRSMCRRCGPAHQRYLSEHPGSVWRTWDKPFLEALPVAVLQWELERHLDSLERFQHAF